MRKKTRRISYEMAEAIALVYFLWAHYYRVLPLGVTNLTVKRFRIVFKLLKL